MKKGAIFVGLILFSFVLIGSFGVVSGEEDVPTIILLLILTLQIMLQRQ